jgi:hypothetical protein
MTPESYLLIAGIVIAGCWLLAELLEARRRRRGH